MCAPPSHQPPMPNAVACTARRGAVAPVTGGRSARGERSMQARADDKASKLHPSHIRQPCGCWPPTSLPRLALGPLAPSPGWPQPQPHQSHQPHQPLPPKGAGRLAHVLDEGGGRGALVHLEHRHLHRAQHARLAHLLLRPHVQQHPALLRGAGRPGRIPAQHSTGAGCAPRRGACKWRCMGGRLADPPPCAPARQPSPSPCGASRSWGPARPGPPAPHLHELASVMGGHVLHAAVAHLQGPGSLNPLVSSHPWFVFCGG